MTLVPTYCCAGCGKETQRRRDMLGGQRKGGWDYAQKYCTSECYYASRVRTVGVSEGHIAADGYHVVHVGGGKKRRLHSIVMEAILGRSLRHSENVHHKNGDRSDNRPENLELWIKSQPCGQRLIDRITHSISFLRSYGMDVAKFNQSEAISGIAGLV